MISKFTLINTNTEQQFTFGQEIDCDFLFKSDGLDWGSVNGSHNTYNYPNQVGVSISSTKLNPRDITIEGYVYYILTAKERAEIPREERNEYCYSKIKQKKRSLDEVINPNDFVKIIIGDYYIEGKPNNSVYYGNTEEDNNTYFCKFLISVYCANPMFKKNTISRTNIQSSTPYFHFPLIIPEIIGISLSSRENYLLLAVENEGSVSIGGRIILTAKGQVTNPTLENIITGETIKINKVMQSGEVITINTSDGSQRGIIGNYGGIERSYLQYWDFSNTWFKFLIGTTLIGYSTDDSSESLLDVAIEINPEKFNLEEM